MYVLGPFGMPEGPMQGTISDVSRIDSSFGPDLVVSHEVQYDICGVKAKFRHVPTRTMSPYLSCRTVNHRVCRPLNARIAIQSLEMRHQNGPGYDASGWTGEMR